MIMILVVYIFIFSIKLNREISINRDIQLNIKNIINVISEDIREN
jgi:hypothetical protein